MLVIFFLSMSRGKHCHITFLRTHVFLLCLFAEIKVAWILIFVNLTTFYVMTVMFFQK